MTLPLFGIDCEQAELAVGDDQPAVLVDLHAVGMALVFGHHLELVPVGQPQHPPAVHVDAMEAALAVEARAFEEAVLQRMEAARVEALVARVALLAQLGRHGGDARGSESPSAARKSSSFSSNSGRLGSLAVLSPTL